MQACSKVPSLSIWSIVAPTLTRPETREGKKVWKLWSSTDITNMSWGDDLLIPNRVETNF